MKNYCCYEERPHFDMRPNFDNMSFEEINIHPNCNFSPVKRPCGCRHMMPPPMPCQMPVKPPHQNCYCDQQMLWLIGGIVIGKLLD